jgi:hypothetical protein
VTEPAITINGRALTVGQAMTVRVAIATLSEKLSEYGLGDDEHGIRTTAAYLDRCDEIIKIIADGR